MLSRLGYIIVAVVAIFTFLLVLCTPREYGEGELCETDLAYPDTLEFEIEAIANTYKHWPLGDTLKIHFFDGTADQQKQALDALQIWGVQIVGREQPSTATPVNLYAQVVPKEVSTVRYKFQSGGGSAYVGNSNHAYFNNRRDYPTIQSSIYSAPHEWGHVLGRSHEHQSGEDPIVWDSAYVYQKMKSRGWSEAQVNHNFFKVFYDSDKISVDPERDLRSVMHYRFPVEYVKPESRGKLPPGSVRYPSVRDKQKLQQDYPLANVPPEPDPIDCKLSEWSDWSACDAECGGGQQERTRTVATQPKNGGKPCGNLLEKRPCNTQPCPVTPDPDPPTDPEIGCTLEERLATVKYFTVDKYDIYRMKGSEVSRALIEVFGIAEEDLPRSSGQQKKLLTELLGY